MRRPLLWGFCLVATLGLVACKPSPEVNVFTYLVEKQLGIYEQPAEGPNATLSGQVTYNGEPVAGVSVVVAEKAGTPHAAVTGPDGSYRIEDVPPGRYMPAAVGPGYEESVLPSTFGIRQYLTLDPGETVEAPELPLARYTTSPLPASLPDAVELELGSPMTVTAPYPAGATAVEQTIQFRRAGITVDTVRLYHPVGQDLAGLPLIFASYPGEVGGWQPVSVAFAHAGFAVVAISPIDAWELDIEAHVEDARTTLALARGGHLGIDLGGAPAVAVGGSFTSAILHRLLRQEGETFEAWVTVGGITNAFSGAAAFHRGELQLPERYRYLIPALGPANLFPLDYLRYSPVYTASELPPTLIIHTAVDQIIPIEQAYQLEAALRQHNVPVDVYYYEDVSHYLQIGEDLTAAGQEMYDRTIEFIREYTG